MSRSAREVTLLLIEPVWNRNFRLAEAAQFVETLLIEPVWNRNNSHIPTNEPPPPTFNRTSMESKRLFRDPPAPKPDAFNRTSMESKLISTNRHGILGKALLIEPVWNRNKGKDFVIKKRLCPLLIEPVWNRNSFRGFLYP